MNQQVKAGLNAVRDFLAGRSGEAKLDDANDQATREVVGSELLAVMSGGNGDEASRESPLKTSGSDTQELPRFEAGVIPETTTEQNHRQQIRQSTAGASLVRQEQSENSKEQEQERARKLFLDHGYFDEAVQNLGAAKSPAERAAAARALGLCGSQRGTAHLIAAMFDDDPEVRSAAGEALGQMGDPTVAKVSVDAVLNNEPEEANDAKPAQSAMRHEGERIERDTHAPEANTVQAHATIETLEAAPLNSTSRGIENPVQQTSATSDLSAISSTATDQENQLLQEEQTTRVTVEQLGKQALETIAALREAENEVRWRIEREGQLRSEAAKKRREEEELRQRADEEAETRRAQEREAVAVEQAARVKAESDAQRYAEAQTNFRLKAARLRLAAEELARRRSDMETARQEAAEAAQQDEAARVRDEANSRHEAALRRQRAEVEAARAKAEAEAERLVEAQARMRAAEEARAQTETERLRLEGEINQQVETQLRLLEETRRRGEEEQERVQEETRRHAEAEEHRLAELEAVKAKVEVESRQRAEKEQQILSQINSLRIADAETRRRIEDAEVRRRAAEDAYRLVAEKVQRVEAEAHARAKEEERILAKLEAKRRTVAVEAQSRAEQEKRIKEEIEMFRRLEDQERPRIEEATLQLAAAEARLQERKDRLQEDEEARVLVEEKLEVVSEYQDTSAEQAGDPMYRHEGVTETVAPRMSPATDETAGTFARSSVTDENLHSVGETSSSDAIAASAVTPAIAAYLNSVDPYKRAAAVAELARSGSKDAFNLIVTCFDDHSPHVRNAAARAFRKLEPNRTVDLFNRALEEASADRRRNIGAAIAASGVAMEAIDNLVSENREDTYNALSLLFVMAKTGEVHPLVQAIEGHESVQVRMAAIKLLTLTGQSDIATTAAKRRLEGRS